MKIQSIEIMAYRPLILTMEKGWIAGEDTQVYRIAKNMLYELEVQARENNLTVLKAITKTVPVKTYNF